MIVKEIITESLNTPFPYTWTEKTSNSWYAKVNSNDIEMDCHFYVINNEDGDDIGWEFSWERDSSVGRIDTDKTLVRKIISTLTNMINDFVNTIKPEDIFFSTTTYDPSKASLFIKIFQKFGYHGEQLPDYKVDELQLYNEYTWYHLSR